MRWESDRLVLSRGQVASGVRLGASKRHEEISIYRMKDGRLILQNVSSEAGIAFLLVPFKEGYESVVELPPKPSQRACP